MGNRTERDTGFGPVEMRRGTAGFPGWRGLQRTGDAVLDPGRFYRNWNAQITDGAIECRGGQLAFSTIDSDEARPHCITSIFCTNNDWPDIGERAEIWVSDVEPANPTAPDSNSYRSWRGDLGTFDAVAQSSITRRQRWLRDGVGNTSSGADAPDESNSSVRIRNRIYRADLDGAIRYLVPGETTWTELAAAGIEFGADKPLAMLHRGKLVVIGIDIMKSYDLDTNMWTVIAMPGGTTGFIPAGWTVFDADDCLYILGTITAGSNVVLIKYDGSTATLSYSAAAASYAALGIASNNGRIAIAWASTNGIQNSIVAEYSSDGASFSSAVIPSNQGPSAMVVADGMIFSAGGWSEEAMGLDLLYSYDGSEWLEVLGMGTTGATSDAYAAQDIVQIAAVDSTVQDTTSEP